MRKYYESDEEFSNEEKYLYSLLYAPGYTGKINEPIRGNTWLHKITHALSKLTTNINFEFNKYDFEASSPSLQVIHIQKCTSELIDQPLSERPLTLSSQGMIIAKSIWNEIPKDVKQTISKIKTFFNEMTYWELIAYSYPEITIQSEIKTMFEKHRVAAAIRLIQKKKISLQKAASVAGKSIDEFEQILLKKQIKPYQLNMDKYKESIELIERIT